MASSSHDQELLPEQTEGFKVGEKKTMDEYNKLGMLCFPFSCGFTVAFERSSCFNAWSSSNVTLPNSFQRPFGPGASYQG
jgi:hypothetical protein